jgi:hypothetical protein
MRRVCVLRFNGLGLRFLYSHCALKGTDFDLPGRCILKSFYLGFYARVEIAFSMVEMGKTTHHSL